MEKILKSKVEFVIVACCTYKRPEKLKRLLDSLKSIECPDTIRTEVLIVDNDINKSAYEIVEKYKNVLKINYVVESEKGLSNARNKALTTAIEVGASHIAFIDDDEIADINWLLNHIDFYNKFENIYISSGPTYKKFKKAYPDYIVNNKIFKVQTSKKLGDIKQTCASGNVFFPLDIIKKSNIYFSEKFNISGGEDTDFFSRLYKAGFSIGWNLNAVNFEIVDEERANLKYILKRAFNVGKIHSLAIYQTQDNISKRLIYIIKKLFDLFFEIAIAILSIFFGPTKFVKTLTTISQNTGKIIGAITLKNSKYYGENDA